MFTSERTVYAIEEAFANLSKAIKMLLSSALSTNLTVCFPMHILCRSLTNKRKRRGPKTLP